MTLTSAQIGGAAALLAGSALSVLVGVYWREDVMFLTRERGAVWISGQPRVSTETFSAHPDRGPEAIFSKRFAHAGKASEATIHLRAPGSVQLALDGDPTFPRDGRGRCWKQACRVTVPLAPGDHSVEIRVVNPIGPPLLFMLLTADGLTVASDATWNVEFPAGRRTQAWAADDTRALPESQDPRTPVRVLIERRAALLGIFALATFAYLLGRRWLPPGARPHLPAAALALLGLFWLLLFAAKYQRIPLEMGFDVAGHLAYIRYILTQGSIPLANEGWSMYHPPLFYLAAAGMLALVDPAVGGDAERWAMRLLPFASAFGCVGVTFVVARRLFPGDVLRTTAAVLVAGLLPLNLYMAAYVSNEASHAFLASLSFAAAVAVMSGREGSSRSKLSSVGLLGLMMGLALLTKFTSLIIVPLVLVFVALEWRVVEGRSVRSILGAVTAMVSIVVLVAGWFYARNWLHFRDPLQWNLDQPGGGTWWQLPGYHTVRYFLRFGEALRHPYYSSFQSLLDGVYSTFWGDGMLAGRTAMRLRNPMWNYDYMSVTYVISVPATLIMLLGFALMVRESFRGPPGPRRCVFSLFATVLYMTAFGLLAGALRYPFWATVKAAYALPAIVPLAVASAFGFGWVHEWLARRSEVLLAVFYGWAGTLVGVIILAFAG
jgi:hypothetical protein